jgi:hypothetical protein
MIKWFSSRFALAVYAVSTIAVLFSSPAIAQIVGHSSTGAMQTLTLTGTAQSLTVPAGTVWATICIEVSAARWRDDGTAPTATVGQPLTAGQCMQYAGPFGALQLIAQSGSPVITVSYYR